MYHGNAMWQRDLERQMLNSDWLLDHHGYHDITLDFHNITLDFHNITLLEKQGDISDISTRIIAGSYNAEGIGTTNQG